MRVVQERHNTNPYRPDRTGSSRSGRASGARSSREGCAYGADSGRTQRFDSARTTRGYRSPNLDNPRGAYAPGARDPRAWRKSAAHLSRNERAYGADEARDTRAPRPYGAGSARADDTWGRPPEAYEAPRGAYADARRQGEPTPAERLQAQHERDFHQVRTARRSQVSAEDGPSERDAAILREQHAHRIRAGHDGASTTITGGVSHGGDRLGRARGIEGLDRSAMGSFTVGSNGVARPGRARRAPQAPHMNDHMTWRSTDGIPRRQPSALPRLILLIAVAIVLIVALASAARGCAAGDAGSADSAAVTAESSTDQSDAATEAAAWRHTATPLANSTDFNWGNLGKDANGRRAYLVNDTVVSEFGVDVSDNMGVVDWDAAKADGVQFAFLRAGYRGTDEGELNADDLFQRNVSNATAAGIPCGAYFYSQARTEDEAREEAEFMLQQIDGKQLDLPIVYDLEVSDSQAGSRVSDLSSEQVSANAQAFCQVISDAGYQPMIYGNIEDLSHIDMVAAGQPPIWFADYNGTPSTNQQLAVWQYSSKAKVDGFDHAVDANLLFRS